MLVFACSGLDPSNSNISDPEQHPSEVPSEQQAGPTAGEAMGSELTNPWTVSVGVPAMGFVAAAAVRTGWSTVTGAQCRCAAGI